MKGEKFILYSHTNTILLELFSSKLYIPLNLKKRERDGKPTHDQLFSFFLGQSINFSVNASLTFS